MSYLADEWKPIDGVIAAAGGAILGITGATGDTPLTALIPFNIIPQLLHELHPYYYVSIYFKKYIANMFIQLSIINI